MTADYRDLITRMAKELDDYRQLLLDDRTVTHRLSDEARAALSDEPAVPEGREPASVVQEPSDAELVGKLVEAANGAAAVGWDHHAQRILRAAELLERHAAPVPKLALAPANDYKSRWLEEDGVMKPVINWIHTIPIEDKDIFHCAQSSCWCSPKVDKDNPEIILHQALTSAQDGWVLIGEIEAASEKPDSLASPPPSELIAELIPELRKVAEHLRDCNFRGFSNYVARAAELLGRNVAPVPVPVSERPPGPEDCDAEGRCWFGTPGCNVWGASWVLRKRSHQRNGITSWLPAHALPLPEVGE